MSRSLSKQELIDLRHKFEKDCRGKGIDIALNSLGNYKSHQAAGLWRDCQARELSGESGN